jgi:hypothetical protein
VPAPSHPSIPALAAVDFSRLGRLARLREDVMGGDGSFDDPMRRATAQTSAVIGGGPASPGLRLRRLRKRRLVSRAAERTP